MSVKFSIWNYTFFDKNFDIFAKIFFRISRLVGFDIFSMKSMNRSNRIERGFIETEKAEITKNKLRIVEYVILNPNYPFFIQNSLPFSRKNELFELKTIQFLVKLFCQVLS